MSQCSCIVVLLGLPASGKSWLAKRLCSFLSDNNCIVNCASYDEILSLEEQAKIALSITSEKTKQYRREMKDIVESFLTECKESPAVKNVVIVDDNNYYRSMRYEYKQLAAKFCTGYLQIYVKCEVAEAILVNRSRSESARVPDNVITQMNLKFEVPCESWENSFTIERSEMENPDMLQTMWCRIQIALANPVLTTRVLEEKRLVATQSKLCNDRNVLHNIDKVLRRRVGESIRERKEENTRVLAVQLNEIRQSIMESVKAGSLMIPADVLTPDGAISLPCLEAWTVSTFLERCLPHTSL